MSSFIEQSDASSSDIASTAEPRVKVAKKSSTKMFKREPAHR